MAMENLSSYRHRESNGYPCDVVAIGILSKLIALVTSTVIAKKIKETPVDLVNETKAVIKKGIDEVENVNEEYVEVLITMIRSFSIKKLDK